MAPELPQVIATEVSLSYCAGTYDWLRDSTIELKDNTVIVVLGASGDLAKKKTVRPPSNLLPANPANFWSSSPLCLAL